MKTKDLYINDSRLKFQSIVEIIQSTPSHYLKVKLLLLRASAALWDNPPKGYRLLNKAYELAIKEQGTMHRLQSIRNELSTELMNSTSKELRDIVNAADHHIRIGDLKKAEKIIDRLDMKSKDVVKKGSGFNHLQIVISKGEDDKASLMISNISSFTLAIREISMMGDKGNQVIRPPQKIRMVPGSTDSLVFDKVISRGGVHVAVKIIYDFNMQTAIFERKTTLL